jgi:subtilisin family serine protease
MKKFSRVVLLLLAFLIIASVELSKAQEPDRSNLSIAGAAQSPKYVPGEVIVKFQPLVSLAAAHAVETRDSLEYSAGVQISEVNPLLRLPDNRRLEDIPVLNQYFILTVDQDVDVELVAEKLTENPNVEFALPNFILHITKSPEDRYFSNQWALRNDDGANLRFEDAWDITTGSSDIVVAVLDTGVDIGHDNPDDDHPDLNSKNTGTGRNFVADPDNSNIQDDNGHGTAVSGIIAAESDNDQGVAGASWGAKIMPVKVCDEYGYCPLDAINNGIVWAADHNGRIINMSFSKTFGPGFGELLAQTMQEAVDYAHSENVVVITSAGNHTEDLDNSDDV